jgi:hypothetical protein
MLAVLLIVPNIVPMTTTVSAQDGDCYEDDESYDDDCYDDEYYDDECYDDEDCYDDEYYDDECYDDEDCYDDEYYDDECFDDECNDDGYNDAYDGEEEVLASYEIDGIDLLGDPEADHLELWDAFVDIIPDQYLDRFITFEVIADEETTGYVYNDDNDAEYYVLALSLTVLDEPDELLQTAVHEFGHTVTLNTEQIDVTSGGSCSTYELDEGCSDDDSYIFAFYTAFYADGQSTSEDDFVTEYAGENIAEDIAESFTFFVREDDERTGNSIADDKVNFFYDFPELVEMRDEIREDIED